MRNDGISINSWRGSAEDLAEFVNRIWEHSYAGKMPFPRWTPEHLKWQLRIDANKESRNLLAAYDCTSPVGVLLGTDYAFRSPAGIHPGSQWGWLSVCPEHRGKGIAKALDRERVQRQKAAGSRLIVSYRYVFSSFSRRAPGQNFSGTEISQESELKRPRAGSDSLSQVAFESDPGTTCATRCLDVMDTSASHT